MGKALRKFKTKLSLAFNSKAITTHQFQKHTAVKVYGEFNNTYQYSIPGLSTVWAEAVPVSKDSYAVTMKRHDTHNGFGISGGSKFYENGISASFREGEKRSLFTREEAVAVLKWLEKGMARDGYMASQKQPFKKRIYTQLENPAA